MFDYKDGKVDVDPNVIIINEFKALYDRDPVNSWNEFKFIWLFCDYKSPYNNYPDELKEIEIIKNEYPSGQKFKKDALVNAAIKRYNELKVTPAMELFSSTKGTMFKLKKYLDSAIIRDGKDGNLTQVLTTIDKLAKVFGAYETYKLHIEKEINQGKKTGSKRRDVRE